MDHIEHLEDLVFQGRISDTLYMLEELGDYFTTGSKLNITTKWDGAPSIVCGKDSFKHFFVATKSAFNAVPKLCYSRHDIQMYYPENKVLADKLVLCLEFLPDLGITNILQGDMMYSYKDLVCENGIIRFKPNVVEYSVPLASTLGRHIYRSQMGIVFHTAYNNNLREASYNVNIGALTPSPHVWFRDASLVNSFGDDVLFEAHENANYQFLVTSISKLYHCVPIKLLNTFSVNETVKRLTKRYVNDTIRKGKAYSSPTDGTSFSATGLINFASGMFNEEIKEAKKPETKLNREQKRDEMMDWFKKNEIGLEVMFTIYEGVIRAKNMVLEKLNQMRNIEMGYYIPEGYVVSDGDMVVKLVDRPSFSYENFKEKNW